VRWDAKQAAIAGVRSLAAGRSPVYDIPGMARNSCTSIVASGEW